MPYDLLALIPAHRAIVSQIRQMFPDETDDDLADTIAGCSDLPDAIAAVIREALAREAMAKGIDEFAAKLADRKSRLLNRASTLRALARTAMEEANLRKIPAPDFTASLGEGRAKVIITDLSKIPDQYLRRAAPEPDKKALGEALKAGETVPGVERGNRPQVLNVRVS